LLQTGEGSEWFGDVGPSISRSSFSDSKGGLLKIFSIASRSTEEADEGGVDKG